LKNIKALIFYKKIIEYTLACKTIFLKKKEKL